MSRTLDCSHIFHRECIGSWLVQRHNCPLCRTAVIVDTPEARAPEMSLQEILASTTCCCRTRRGYYGYFIC